MICWLCLTQICHVCVKCRVDPLQDAQCNRVLPAGHWVRALDDGIRATEETAHFVSPHLMGWQCVCEAALIISLISSSFNLPLIKFVMNIPQCGSQLIFPLCISPPPQGWILLAVRRFYRTSSSHFPPPHVTHTHTSHSSSHCSSLQTINYGLIAEGKNHLQAQRVYSCCT